MSSGREEGEIDSEEDGLRKRIHELENENAEYERIKRISECYEDKYGNMYRLNDYNAWEAVQRAGQVPTDVSSISSVEFPTPKKKKHKRKKNKCKMHDRHLQSRSHRCTHQRHKHCKSQFHGERRHHHRRERLLNPYYESRIETISLDTSDNSDYEKDNYSIATMDIESPDETAAANTTLPLNREELRLALCRSAGERKNNTCSLRQRLQPDKVIELEDIEKTETMEESAGNSNDVENVVEINSDNSISIEEQELRLIALRSAIMRKHATRKKRNAEIAYSPTDFDDLLVEPVGSPIGTDIVDLDGDMEISPASSPRLLLSPIQCDEEGNSNLSLEMVDQQVDNKPVDMDLASSDSEVEEDNGANVVNASLEEQQMQDIPLPAGAPMESVNLPMPYNYANHGNVMPYDIYVSAMPYRAPLDMPQAVLPIPSFPATTALANLEKPSAFTKVIPLEFVKNENVNEERRLSASPKSTTMEIITEETQEQPEECSDEDEAQALRALLLSQRQAAKSTKMNGLRLSGKSSPAQVTTLNDENRSQHTEIGVKVENIIRAQAQATVDSSKPTPTESILKEAVRRLKVKTIEYCDNVEKVPLPPIPIVPRLKIKAFARCRDFDDVNNAQAQTSTAIENDISTDHTQATNAKSACNHFTQHDESRSSNESMQRRGTPEILGIQTNSNENTGAMQPTKRRLEKEGVTALTLRLKELKQLSEGQYTSEESNGEMLENSNTEHNYEIYPKKAKIATEHARTAPVTVPNNLKSKEHMPEVSTKERNTGGNSGEKENQARTTTTPIKTINTATVVPKSIQSAKPAAKTLKGAVKKKVNATPTAVKSIAAPPKMTVAPPPKIVKPMAQLKIVKPNKVINKNLELPPKKQKSDDVSTQKKPEASMQQSRILTPTTLHNIKVNKLIIRVGDSSSEDEEVLRNQTLERCIGLAGIRTSTPDSLAYALNQNIYSSREYGTQMEATGSAKAQINEDISNASSAKEPALGESFEKKLENFLKNIRSKTHQPSDDSAAHAHARVRKISLSNSSAQTGTPTAVRSLPIASQEEYKRLVHRMKILEKQKHLKKMQKSLLEDTEKYTKIQQGAAKRLHKTHNAMQRIDEDSQTVSTGTQTSNDASTAADENTVATTTPPEQSCSNEHSASVIAKIVDTDEQCVKASAKNEKVVTEKLSSWEKIYASISKNILTRLDKSLALVQEAKSAKIAKMRHEQRIQQLRLEMEQTQRKMKEEQMKITRIHPQICTNNELITKLRQKRAKVQEMAVKLGKSVQGDDYRLNNDLKNEIVLKTKGLATHIKLVNSIRYCDLDILDKHQETILPDNSTQKSINMKILEKQRSIVEEVTNSVPPATSTDSVIVENVENILNALPTQAEKTLTNIEETTMTLAIDENAFDKQKNAQQAVQNNLELSTAHKAAGERQTETEIVYQRNESPTVLDEENADKQTSAKEAADACDSPSLVLENTDNEQINTKGTSENCDKLNEVQPTAYVEAVADVACVAVDEAVKEELHAPCDSGKEVLRETDNRKEEDNVQLTQPAALETKMDRTLREYVSPLAPLRCESGNWDPNAIICPYELMGQCEDKDCNYKHFNGKIKQVVT
uniref:Putative zinc-finger domain-containing protein n=1 Tax=Ceratitis capitata TaxID=7213 RepID=W8ATZ2_CERCA